MDKMLMEQLWKEFTKDAVIIPNEKRRFRKSQSSLHSFIKTKDQAEQFMRSVDQADEVYRLYELRRAAEEGHHTHTDLNR